jgi:2-dehydropantoate 2-reductase
MTNKYKIGILGIGGVGGYLANNLVSKFNGSEEYEVFIITRPGTQGILKSKGLKLINSDKENLVYPENIISDTSQIGKLDVILICVKSYDIVESINLLIPCIGENTILLPFLNGADITERIQHLVPDRNVIYGCVYIVSRLLEPGIVKIFSPLIQFYIGDIKNNDSLIKINKFLKEAGINSEISNDIKKTIWEKFIFISPFATLTSYLDKPIGAIFENVEYKNLMKSLIDEVVELARKKQIQFDTNVADLIMARMQMIPYETTSSMHSDFEKVHKTELESLTGYIVKLGNELKVSTPIYKMMLDALNEKALKIQT